MIKRVFGGGDSIRDAQIKMLCWCFQGGWKCIESEPVWKQHQGHVEFNMCSTMKVQSISQTITKEYYTEILGRLQEVAVSKW